MRKMLLTVLPLYLLVVAPSSYPVVGNHCLALSPLLLGLMIGLPAMGMTIGFIGVKQRMRRRSMRATGKRWKPR